MTVKIFCYGKTADRDSLGHYAMLWRAEELIEMNQGYMFTLLAPAIFAIGSNGGGEAYFRPVYCGDRLCANSDHWHGSSCNCPNCNRFSWLPRANLYLRSV
jgi:hypothetical protein